MGGWVQPKGFLWNRDNNNFRPRLGLAWSTKWNTVFRAGFGMNTSGLEPGLYHPERNRRRQLLQSVRLAGRQRLYSAFQHQLRACRRSFRSRSWRTAKFPPRLPRPRPRPTITVYPANYHNPYVINWNVSVQHSFKKDYLLEVDYVGMHNVGFGGTL